MALIASEAIPISDGLQFIISHFEDPIFPRRISTKLTEGKQQTVYDWNDILDKFSQANNQDCKICAYPYLKWKWFRFNPNFLFIDLDLGAIGSMRLLDIALAETLNNIKSQLGGFPSVLWSGGGYHVYQPVQGVILEEYDIFDKFENPSQGFLRYAEQYLSNGKSDQCHNHTMSFRNCMLRIPGSYNCKYESVQVKIIQRWDSNRVKVNPLMFGCYLYLQDLKVKKILNSEHGRNKFCLYWMKDNEDE